MQEMNDLKIQEYQPTAFIFHDSKTNKEIGKLFLESPMRFEGDVEQSAKQFFDEILRLGSK